MTDASHRTYLPNEVDRAWASGYSDDCYYRLPDSELEARELLTAVANGECMFQFNRLRCTSIVMQLRGELDFCDPKMLVFEFERTTGTVLGFYVQSRRGHGLQVTTV